MNNENVNTVCKPKTFIFYDSSNLYTFYIESVPVIIL